MYIYIYLYTYLCIRREQRHTNRHTHSHTHTHTHTHTYQTGATAYSPTSDGKYKMYLNTGGRYKFYNAAQYSWRIQWCAYGK